MTIAQKLDSIKSVIATLPVPDSAHITCDLGDVLEIDVHGCGIFGLAEAIAAHADNGEDIEVVDNEYGRPKYATVESDGVAVTYYL